MALILVRRLLDFVFSQHDLAWIDNIIPEKEKKKEDDKKKKKKGNKGDSSSDEEVGTGSPGVGTSQSWGGRIPTGTSGFGMKVWDSWCSSSAWTDPAE